MKVKIAETVPCSSQQSSLGSHGDPRHAITAQAREFLGKQGNVKHEVGVWKTIAAAIRALAGLVALIKLQQQQH